MRNKLIKVILGLLSILTPITFILMFVFVGNGESTTNVFFIILVALTMLSFPGLMVFYICHVYKISRVNPEQKHLWAALLFFGSIVVYPIYWYLHIWREPKKEIINVKS